MAEETLPIMAEETAPIMSEEAAAGGLQEQAMADEESKFDSFFNYIRRNFDKSRTSAMFGQLHYSLLKVLKNPFSVGYTSHYLSYLVMVEAINRSSDTDISVPTHLRVTNDPGPNDKPVDTKALKYLAQSERPADELLADIMGGGHDVWMNGHKAGAQQNRLGVFPAPGPPVGDEGTPDLGPRESTVRQEDYTCELPERLVWMGCDVDEIPIPPLIDIQRHLEPYLTKLQSIWSIRLGLDKERRLLRFWSLENQICNAIDDMISDRHRQEFRSMFLDWIKGCFDVEQSTDFWHFHCICYLAETEGFRTMSEERARDIKAEHIDTGAWEGSAT
ncbi:hypothetical protein F5Y14DRAFT_463043 [Nemania sp. NC0429]|nr:hypothetical protein F5Y14DRAFT_463043 [Nemania sp. NC0429]